MTKTEMMHTRKKALIFDALRFIHIELRTYPYDKELNKSPFDPDTPLVTGVEFREGVAVLRASAGIGSEYANAEHTVTWEELAQIREPEVIARALVDSLADAVREYKSNKSHPGPGGSGG